MDANIELAARKDNELSTAAQLVLKAVPMGAVLATGAAFGALLTKKYSNTAVAKCSAAVGLAVYFAPSTYKVLRDSLGIGREL